jgi:Family of unknown function (DUF5908)
MTIEVRQMLIRSRVGEGPEAPAQALLDEATLERTREALLAELKQWLDERLRAREER